MLNEIPSLDATVKATSRRPHLVTLVIVVVANAAPSTEHWTAAPTPFHTAPAVDVVVATAADRVVVFKRGDPREVRHQRRCVVAVKQARIVAQVLFVLLYRAHLASNGVRRVDQSQELGVLCDSTVEILARAVAVAAAVAGGPCGPLGTLCVELPCLDVSWLRRRKGARRNGSVWTLLLDVELGAAVVCAIPRRAGPRGDFAVLVAASLAVVVVELDAVQIEHEGAHCVVSCLCVVVVVAVVAGNECCYVLVFFLFSFFGLKLFYVFAEEFVFFFFSI